MKLYWYEMKNGEIKLHEYEVKETAKLYKSLSDRDFPYECRMTIEKESEGKILKSWSREYVFFTEKNLEKARDLFVEAQKNEIESNKRQIEQIENKNEELERQIDRLENMETE